MNKKLGWSLCLLALALCSMPAIAQTTASEQPLNTLYSNFGSDNTIYNCCTGWIVSGTSSPVGESFISANEFQVTTGGSVSQIDVAVALVTAPDSFIVNVDANNNGVPGTVLASFTGLNSNGNNFGVGCFMGNSCPYTSITGISGLTLSTGTNYWLVISPSSTSSTTFEAWNFSNSATGNDDYSTDGGNTWNMNGTQPQGAFQILGGAPSTPEPTSLLLLGTGLVGAFGAFRRMMKL